MFVNQLPLTLRHSSVIQTEWIKMFCLLMRLLYPEKESALAELQIYPTLPSVYGWITPDSLTSYSFVLTDTRSHKALKEYLLIPRQNLCDAGHGDDSAWVKIRFLTVTPYVIVFEVLHGSVDADILPIVQNFERHFLRLIAVDTCEKIIRQEQGFTIQTDLQVIRFREYPHYIDLETAGPGSRIIDRLTVRELGKEKIIRWSVVPDRGKPRRQWIEGNHPTKDHCAELTAILEMQAMLTGQDYYPSYLRNDMNTIALKQRLRVALTKSGCDTNVTDLWVTQLRQWLWNADPRYADIRRVYPDYEPKQTPDSITDYRPSLIADIGQLPPAELDSLGSLLRWFRYYEAAAGKNKGKWIKGNLTLGANEKEYSPSKDELLLNACGDRIRKIVENYSSDEIDQWLKTRKIKTLKIRYQHFTFRYVDVLGSGRYFYVDRSEGVTLFLRK